MCSRVRNTYVAQDIAGAAVRAASWSSGQVVRQSDIARLRGCEVRVLRRRDVRFCVVVLSKRSALACVRSHRCLSSSSLSLPFGLQVTLFLTRLLVQLFCVTACVTDFHGLFFFASRCITLSFPFPNQPPFLYLSAFTSSPLTWASSSLSCHLDGSHMCRSLDLIFYTCSHHPWLITCHDFHLLSSRGPPYLCYRVYLFTAGLSVLVGSWLSHVHHHRHHRQLLLAGSA